MAGTQRPEGMGSVWIMGPQGSERGLADPEIQGLELRDKPGLEVRERDCGIRSEMLRLLGGWNDERGRWVMEPRGTSSCDELRKERPLRMRSGGGRTWADGKEWPRGSQGRRECSRQGHCIRGCFSGVWQGSKEGLVRNLSCVEEEAGSRQLPEEVVGWFISLLGPP